MPSNKPKTIDDYISLAQSHNIHWVDEDLPLNVHTSTRWECPSKHRWLARYTNIKSGYGCPVCANKTRNNLRRIPPDMYKLVAETANPPIEWIGEYPADVRTSTRWRCKTCHNEWTACYYSIKRGSGCAICSKSRNADKLRLSTQQYIDLATLRGFEWLEIAPPKNNLIKTKWRCFKGHEWFMGYGDIQQGSGCPYCDERINGVPVSKPQLALYTITGGKLNYPVGRKRIDIALWIDDLPIAIEYDCGFWHDPIRDKKRDAFLISKGWHILRVKSAHLLPTEHQLNDAIDTLLSGATYTEIILPDWKPTKDK